MTERAKSGPSFPPSPEYSKSRPSSPRHNTTSDYCAYAQIYARYLSFCTNFARGRGHRIKNISFADDSTDFVKNTEIDSLSTKRN